MYRVVLICGHGGKDIGALNKHLNINERDLVRMVGKEMKRLAPERVMLLDTTIDHYTTHTVDVFPFKEGDEVIELHADGFSSQSAKGGHVEIKQGFEPDLIDKNLADYISKAPLDGRAEKIVKRSDLRNMNVCAKRGVSYRLLEMGFITNNENCSYVFSNYQKIATGILKCFGIVQSDVKPSENQAAENVDLVIDLAVKQLKYCIEKLESMRI